MTRTSDSNLEWLEIKVTVPAEFAEPVTHLFSRHGDGRVFVEQLGDWDADDLSDPMPEPEVTVHCYLLRDHSLDERKTHIDVGIALIGELTPIKPAVERSVDSSEWENQSFPPVRVGERISIIPIDELGESIQGALESPNGGVTIHLAPGLAFGTGNHPTTRMCLKQIEEEFSNSESSASTVLDVGCGSGVLSIAALKLGASKAWCLDTDATAIHAVGVNVEASGVGDRAQIVHGSLPCDESPSEGCDFVFGNITGRVIIGLADVLAGAVRPGGVLIVSGVLAEGGKDVLDAFSQLDVELTHTRREGDWLMYRFIRAV